jgi:hypothetical protein
MSTDGITEDRVFLQSSSHAMHGLNDANRRTELERERDSVDQCQSV